MTNSSVYHFNLPPSSDQAGLDNKEDGMLRFIKPTQPSNKDQLNDGQLLNSIGSDVSTEPVRSPALVCKIDLSRMPLLNKFKPRSNETAYEETGNKNIYYTENQSAAKSFDFQKQNSQNSPLMSGGRRSFILEQYKQRISSPDYFFNSPAQKSSEAKSQTGKIDLYDLNKTPHCGLDNDDDRRKSLQPRDNEGSELSDSEYFHSDISGRRETHCHNADKSQPHAHREGSAQEDLYSHDSLKSRNCKSLQTAFSSLKMNSAKDSAYFSGDIKNNEPSPTNCRENTQLDYENKQTVKNRDLPFEINQAKPKTCDYFHSEETRSSNYMHSHTKAHQTQAKNKDSRVSVYGLQQEHPSEYTAFYRQKHTQYTDIPNEGFSPRANVHPYEDGHKRNLVNPRGSAQSPLDEGAYFSSGCTGSNTIEGSFQGHAVTPVNGSADKSLNLSETQHNTKSKIHPYNSSLRVSALDEEIQAYYKPQWQPLRDTSSDVGSMLRHQDLCDTSETGEEESRVIGSVVIEHLRPPVTGRVYLYNRPLPEDKDVESNEIYSSCWDGNNYS